MEVIMGVVWWVCVGLWGLYGGYVGFMGVIWSLVKLYVNGMAMFMMFSYICEDHVKVT